MKKPIRFLFLFIVTLFFVTGIVLSFSPTAGASLSILKNAIIEYNVARHQKILTNGSYRGQEGILMLRPELALSLGLRVLMDEDYVHAKEMFKKAGGILGKLNEALITQNPEQFRDEHEKRIAQLALDYKSTLRSAQEKMMSYHYKLNPAVDDRLNDDICSKLLVEFLSESAKEASCNLRETMGLFYNKCQTLDKRNEPLNVANIHFVNHVVREFKEKAAKNSMGYFGLKGQSTNGEKGRGEQWKHALGKPESRYLPLLESIIEEQNPAEHTVDLLLFLALIRQESNFNPRAVSSVGAVGLTQIMPQTATALGMNNIFAPPYFKEAGSLVGQERNLRNRAMRLIFEISAEDCLKTARLARKLVQRSLDCKQKRINLYARYRKEILENKADDRLKPRKAVEYGFKYFEDMMAHQKGDVSLALASYNAGPNRVKKYKGIPPYRETIRFRNRVMKYYRDYLRKLNMYHDNCPAGIEASALADGQQLPEITEIDQSALDIL